MKPPAFQFYADDFSAGVRDMSAEEVGSYILLLCYQWSKGAIPSEKHIADRIAGCCVSDAVLAKFPEGKNPRLEIERQKQDEWREKCRIGGKHSAETRKGSSTNLPRVVQLKGQVNGNTPYSTLHSPLSSLQSPIPSPDSDSNKDNGSATNVAPFALETDSNGKHHAKLRFVAPSIEACRLLAAKSGIPEAEGDKFFHYYASNGWRVGKNPMRSAEHAIGSWAARYRERSFGGNGSGLGQSKPPGNHTSLTAQTIGSLSEHVALAQAERLRRCPGSTDGSGDGAMVS